MKSPKKFQIVNNATGEELLKEGDADDVQSWFGQNKRATVESHRKAGDVQIIYVEVIQ